MIPDPLGFARFMQMVQVDNSKPALAEARKFVNKGEMVSAATFVSLMLLADQEIFLKEIENDPRWQTAEVAILLGQSNPMKEAMEIMEKFPSSSDRKRFLNGIYKRQV